MIGRIGEFVVTLFRRGSVWWVRYRVRGRQLRESLGTDNRELAHLLRSRKEAELFESERLAVLRVGVRPNEGASAAVDEAGREPVEARSESVVVPARVDVVRGSDPVPTLEELRTMYEEWSCAHKKPKTILNDRSRLDAFFAQVPVERLDDVSVAHCERFIARLAMAGKTPATILRYREILHAFFRWAERCGYANRNPVTATRRPRVPRREPRFLALDDIDQVLGAVAGDRIEPLVAVAIFAGLRREELCWLRWEDIRWDTSPPMLQVRAKRVGRESWQPKTGRDRRVPISPRLLAFLERHRAAMGEGASGWLFESPQGCRWDPDNLGRHLRRLMSRAGLRWNFLEMRHTFGSHLAQKGVSLLKIATLMGNSPEVARCHYISLSPEEMAVDVAF